MKSVARLLLQQQQRQQMQKGSTTMRVVVFLFAAAQRGRVLLLLFYCYLLRVKIFTQKKTHSFIHSSTRAKELLCEKGTPYTRDHAREQRGEFYRDRIILFRLGKIEEEDVSSHTPFRWCALLRPLRAGFPEDDGRVSFGVGVFNCRVSRKGRRRL